MKKGFLVSIVVPVYNEEGNINLLLSKLIPVINKYSYEIIFVNDGSNDKTIDEVKKQSETNNNIKLVSFIRNFGHQYALSAGYFRSKGDCVITIDADLQDPPELIDEMIKKWQRGYKIVYAKRSERHESFFKKQTASVFYKLINALSDTPVPENVGDFRLLDRVVVDFLNNLPEQNLFYRGLVAWSGYPSTNIEFVRQQRQIGNTHYPLIKMLNFALNGITSLSTKPLKFATYLGFISSFLGGAGVGYGLYRRLFLPSEYWVTGWTAIFVSVMFFGGVQLVTIGIIGEYIGKIYKEIQGRPSYLVDENKSI